VKGHVEFDEFGKRRVRRYAAAVSECVFEKNGENAQDEEWPPALTAGAIVCVERKVIVGRMVDRSGF
jgi:hypothetical protein